MFSFPSCMYLTEVLLIVVPAVIAASLFPGSFKDPLVGTETTIYVIVLSSWSLALLARVKVLVAPSFKVTPKLVTTGAVLTAVIVNATEAGLLEAVPS